MDCWNSNFESQIWRCMGSKIETYISLSAKSFKIGRVFIKLGEGMIQQNVFDQSVLCHVGHL